MKPKLSSGKQHGGVLFVCMGIFTGAMSGQQTTLSLAAEPKSHPPVLSEPVKLTATITPPTAPGYVIFYDRTAILGISDLVAGKAELIVADFQGLIRATSADSRLGCSNHNHPCGALEK